MDRREFLIAGMSGLAAASMARAAQTPAAPANLGLLLYSYSIRAKVEKDRGFSDPVHFLQFAHQRGAAAVQLPLGVRTQQEALEIRRACERLQMQVEGIVAPPKEGAAEIDRFTAELKSARDCGTQTVRTVMLGGRRYEVFNKAEDYVAFAKSAEESLARAAPIADAAKVIVAVENHKDFRVDELIDLLKKISSESVGVCIDTGNNLALLEDPQTVVEALAPWVRSVHLKDIGVEESTEGFRMSEVPLGQGTFDLKRMVNAIRQGNPKVIFHLEMITRDPLLIPCLTDKYWATLSRVPVKDVASTLGSVRRSERKQPLPRITSLSNEDQLALEDKHVQESFEFASRTSLIPAAAPR
jgi:sugar phosphate isomerase/epimerase